MRISKVFLLHLHKNRQTMTEKKEYAPSSYLLHQISDLIEEHGVAIINYSSSLLVENEEYISPYFVIALCHQGYIKSYYDMKSVEFHAHDISVMRPGHVIKNRAASDDYSAQLIVITASLHNKILQQYLNHYLATRKSFDSSPCQHLNEKQYHQVCDIISLLQTTCSIKGFYHDELLTSIIHTLIVLLSSFRHEQIEQQQEVDNQLSQQFNNAIIEHYRKSRDVSFYARMFHLSPKYFSTLIKQETGISAGEWINRYVVIQAKTLLEQERNLTIQQVADQMGFSEQASFSRFFKRHTGMTPKEYREQE